MSKPTEIAGRMTSQEKVAASLKRRYWAERRFRAYGLAAVMIGVLFVVLLFGTIIQKGHTAFEQAYIQLDVAYPADDIDVADIASADFQAPIRAALRARFPAVTERAELRKLYALVSTAAPTTLQKRVEHEHALIGKHERLWLLAGSKTDMVMKGQVDLTLPESTASTPMLWWTRGAFIVGGALAALLAFILFAIITQRLVLRPVRQLRQVADKVTEGDMGVRSKIKTGDELQRLGESFNEMLEAIDEQHQKLQNANRALDLRLSELAEANVTLFQANKVKNEFLANVSHELRTPLNSIIGFADLLAENQDQRIGRYGGNISSAAKNLLSMINDLLDIAKIEAGKTDVRMDKVSVTDICNSLMGLMQPLAEKKQLALKWQVDPDLPIVVTDATKLQQILYNLLSNAVKFTPAGGEIAPLLAL